MRTHPLAPMLCVAFCGCGSTQPGVDGPETRAGDGIRSSAPEPRVEHGGAPFGIDEPIQIAAAPALRSDGSVGLLYLSNTDADHFVERSPDGTFRTERLPTAVSLGVLFPDDAGYLLLHYDGAGHTRLSRGPPWSIIAEEQALAGAPGSAARDAAGRTHAVLGGEELGVFDGRWTRRPLGVRCAQLHAVLVMAPDGRPHVACWSSQASAWAVYWIGPEGNPEPVTNPGSEVLDNARLALAVGDDGRPHVFFTRRGEGGLALQHAVRGPGGFRLETLVSHPLPEDCPSAMREGDTCERTSEVPHALSAHVRRGVLELVYAETRREASLRAAEQGVRERYLGWEGEARVTARVWLEPVGQGRGARQLLFEGSGESFSPSARASVDSTGRLHVAGVVGQKPQYVVVR